MTLNQAAVLFYGRHDGYQLDLDRARDSLKHRIAQLVNAGFLSKGVTRYGGKLNVRAYYIAPAGARVLKDLRETEYMEAPDWVIRKQNRVWSYGAHDLMVGSFLVNLMMLDRLKPDFTLIDWKSSYDTRYFIRRGDHPLVFDPDLYLAVSFSEFDSLPIFLELDNSNISMANACRKIQRIFQYYESGKWRSELNAELFPRIAILVPGDSRITFFRRAISSVKKSYQGQARLHVQRFTFFLSTFSQVDLFSIDQGRVSEKPLSRYWQTSEGQKGVSPFLK